MKLRVEMRMVGAGCVEEAAASIALGSDFQEFVAEREQPSALTDRKSVSSGLMGTGPMWSKIAFHSTAA